MTSATGLGNRLAAWFLRAAAADTVGAIRRRVGRSALYALALLPISAIAAFRMGQTPIEYSLFGPAGANLLTGHLNLVFTSARVQAGPFEILPYGVARLLGLHSTTQWFVFYLVTLWVMTFILCLVMFLPIQRLTGRLGLYLPILVLALALLGDFLPTVITMGHPAEVTVPLLWIVAGSLSRERRFAAAGIVIALSTGFEVWGILGIPVLFLATSPRIVRAGIATVVTVALIYVPFLLTGTFRMFGYRWPVAVGTLSRVLFPHLNDFPWSFRLAQAVFALAAGWVVALLTRRTLYAMWLVPLAIIAVRLVFDPLLDFYYWMAPATIALCALAATVYLRKWVASGTAAVVIVWLWNPPTRSLAAALALTAIVAVCVVGVKLGESRARRRELSVEAVGASRAVRAEATSPAK